MCSSQFYLHWAGPHLPWGMQRIWEFFVVWRDFCQPAGPFAARLTLIEDSPKLPWGMQRIHRGPYGSFCFKDHHYESFCLSRDSLSCATRSLDLCILFKFIFLYLWYIPPLSCSFHTFCFHQFFDMYQYHHAKYFCYPWWWRWSAKARNLILSFKFSSQRPHFGCDFTILSRVCFHTDFYWV